MNDVRILVPLINTHPHLCAALTQSKYHRKCSAGILTFRNVLRPARMLPPIHVLYFRSGGANILIRMSFTASRCTSWSSRSPNPLQSVEPPDKTMFPNSDFRRSISVRLMASTTIWWIPGYSSPISSGSKRISGAFHRSDPIYYRISISSSHVLLLILP